MTENNKITDIVTFFKPNEIVAVIDTIKVTRTAKHLCNYFLKYAQEQIKFHNHTSAWFELDISTINELAALKTHNISEIEKSLNALMQPVTIRDKDNRNLFAKFVLFSTMVVDLEKWIYRFELSGTMIDLLRIDSNYFTKLNLLEFNPLSSKYSIILYELLLRYKGLTSIEMPIELLRDVTHVADKKAYDNFTNFKNNVIDVAVNEISEKTPYNVKYDAIKTKKDKTKSKVTAVKFFIIKKKDTEEQKEENPYWNLANIPVYEKLKKICPSYMDKEFYCKATYIYPLCVLEQFADDCLNNPNKVLKPYKRKFYEWLEDRCKKHPAKYYTQNPVYSEDYFRTVFVTKHEDPDSATLMINGKDYGLGKKIITTVHEEYIEKAIHGFGIYPYNEYRKYLSGIWNKFQQEFKVNADNVFEQS